MTNEEYFRLHNTLPADRIAKLLDENANKVDRDDIPFDKILWQLPEYGFTHEIEDRLHNLAKCLRGNNKAEVVSILALVELLADNQFEQGEYDRSVVDDFLAGKS